MKVLNIKNLIKEFGDVRILDNISFDIEKGTTNCIIGPNGTGKTTIFNIINGFILPNTGNIQYCGEPIIGLPPWKIARLGVGRLFQDIRLFNEMTVLENILVSFPNYSFEKVSSSLLTRWKIKKKEQEIIEKAEKLLMLVKLQDKASCIGKNLSFGEQKLLAFAKVLATDSNLLLLDEPFAGLNYY
ncbi:MAG TPA: ATP-binding cassette domain-containing protein, partial [Chitinophagaceae bacterium]|nr:ATP-binding cassette domain-containing protein [Chitinophagaceae bacterium]